MFRKWVSFGAVILVGLLLSGCYTDFGPVASEPNPIPPPSVGSFLQLGDRVTVTVYGETDLTSIYDVNPNGNLNLPLIGAVKAVRAYDNRPAARHCRPLQARQIPRRSEGDGRGSPISAGLSFRRGRPPGTYSVRQWPERADGHHHRRWAHLSRGQIDRPHPARRGTGVDAISDALVGHGIAG